MAFFYIILGKSALVNQGAVLIFAILLREKRANCYEKRHSS